MNANGHTKPTQTVFQFQICIHRIYRNVCERTIRMNYVKMESKLLWQSVVVE